MDKFSHMPGLIGEHMRNWEADAIEKCRNDPSIAAAGLCYVCMCEHPCLCEKGVITGRMRRVFDVAHMGRVFIKRQTRGCAYDPIEEFLRDLLRVTEQGLEEFTPKPKKI